MIRRSIPYLSVLSLGALAACGRPVPESYAQEYAEAICAAVDSCGCFERAELEGGCEERYSSLLLGSLASEIGLELDAECFDLIIDELMTAPCEVSSDAPCALLVAQQALGEPCSNERQLGPVQVEPCGAGLTCWSGVCVADEDLPIAPSAVSPGDPCSFSVGPTDCFGINLYCAPDDQCRVSAGIGEPCDNPWGCHFKSADDEYLYCEGLGEGGVGLCSRRAPLGEPCDPADYTPCYDPGYGQSEVWCAPESAACELMPPALCTSVQSPSRWFPAESA